MRQQVVSALTLGTAAAVFGLGLAGPIVVAAQSPSSRGTPTFTRDIAPILQRKCQRCHRPESIAPIVLMTYDQVRPYARSIKNRTGLRGGRGSMPPWFIERNVGIQMYKDDLSLTDEEIATIAAWVDNGALAGNPADMPPPLNFADTAEWEIGKPDLVVTMPDVVVGPNDPDRWTPPLESVPTGLIEDRYVEAVETREMNDVGGTPPRQTVGGRFVFHHASIGILNEDPGGNPSVEGGGGGLTLHEVGRNAEWFDPLAGKLLRANARIGVGSAHLHSNGKWTRSHLVVGLKFFPKGYKPAVTVAGMIIGVPSGIDIKPMQADQRLDAYYTLPENARLTGWEPHLHAAGVRMCYEAIWGRSFETLSCAKYDGNWVLAYTYADDAAPLLPKGTILHVIGYADNTPANRNVPDPRNWSGDGQRTVDNMFGGLVKAVFLTDDQFQAEVTKRREIVARGGSAAGCPLCLTAGISRAARRQ